MNRFSMLLSITALTIRFLLYPVSKYVSVLAGSAFKFAQLEDYPSDKSQAYL